MFFILIKLKYIIFLLRVRFGYPKLICTIFLISIIYKIDVENHKCRFRYQKNVTVA